MVQRPLPELWAYHPDQGSCRLLGTGMGLRLLTTGRAWHPQGSLLDPPLLEIHWLPLTRAGLMGGALATVLPWTHVLREGDCLPFAYAGLQNC